MIAVKNNGKPYPFGYSRYEESDEQITNFALYSSAA